MTKLTHTLVLLIVILNSLAQTTYPTQDNIHIFWQPGIKLTINDFKGDTAGRYKESYKSVGIKAMGYIGIWSILNVPKKKKDRGNKLEKVYIAPAFDKAASYIFSNDPTQTSIQEVYFDIAETWARWGRKQLQSYQDSMRGYGTLYIMYSTVIKDMKAGQKEMNDAYTRDVIIEKKIGAFERWRKIIFDKLSETNLWATKSEDCYRFLIDKPIDSDYEQSPTVLGAIPNNSK
jgi:hypothetical protein